MSRRWPSRFTGLVAAFAAAAVFMFTVPGRAETLDGNERAAIQALIVSQMSAFARDDGAAAYALASPGTRDTFPTVEAFMAMVRHDYTPVYRPRTVLFGPLVDGLYGPMQVVFVIGSDGLSYVATYSLERQPDGGWMISGCAIVRNNSPRI